jgi:hypothetical protein
MQKTDAELLTEANIIKDETTPRANSAERVGEMLVDLIDSKVSKDDFAGYLSFVGTVNTLRSGNYSINVLKNDLGAYALTYLQDGVYQLTFSSAPVSFSNLNTYCSINKVNSSSSEAVYQTDIQFYNANSTDFFFTAFNGTIYLENDAFNQASFEIRVY